MPHFITKHGGDLTHITDDPAGNDRYRTRCNRRLRYAHLGVRAGSECTACGTPEEFAAVSEQQRQEYLAKEAARKQANEEVQARREARVAAQRQSTNHLAQILLRIPGIQYF